MNKEPLASNGRLGQERTARPPTELGITRSRTRRTTFSPTSRSRARTRASRTSSSRATETDGEAAAYGDGFYTRRGASGARGTGLTIRFSVNPEAREGKDFTARRFVIFRNRNALRVIPESLSLEPEAYFRFLLDGEGFDHSDLGILERLKRRVGIKLRALGAPERGRIVSILVDTAVPRERRLIAIQEWLTGEAARRVPESGLLLRNLLASDDADARAMTTLLYLSKQWHPFLAADPGLRDAFRLDRLVQLAGKLPGGMAPFGERFTNDLGFHVSGLENPFVLARVRENPVEAFRILLRLFEFESKMSWPSTPRVIELQMIETLKQALETVVTDTPAALAEIEPLVDGVLNGNGPRYDVIKHILGAPAYAASPRYDGWLRLIAALSPAEGMSRLIVHVMPKPHVTVRPIWRELADQLLANHYPETASVLLSRPAVVARADWPELMREAIRRGFKDTKGTKKGNWPLMHCLLADAPLARPEWASLAREFLEHEEGDARAFLTGLSLIDELISDDRVLKHPEWEALIETVAIGGHHDQTLREIIERIRKDSPRHGSPPIARAATPARAAEGAAGTPAGMRAAVGGLRVLLGPVIADVRAGDASNTSS